MVVTRLFLSPAHVYAGHFGSPAGTEPMVEVDRVQALAGRGLVGDRYVEGPPGHKGQVTFFAEETWQRLCQELGVSDRGPEVFRRNVLVRGAELNALIGFVMITDGAAGMAEAMAPAFGISPDDALHIPLALLGTLDEMAEELEWRRQEYGISYWSIEADCWEDLGPVVSRLAGT